MARLGRRFPIQPYVSKPSLRTTARRYYISRLTPAVTPAFGALWDLTAGALYFQLNEVRQNTALQSETELNFAETDASQLDYAHMSLVSEVFASSETISDTFSLVISCATSSGADADLSVQCVVRTVDATTGAHVATIYAGHSAALNTTVGAIGEEVQTSTRATRVMAAVPVTTTTVQAGQRLVVELGFRHHNTLTTSVTGYFNRGDPTGTADWDLTSGLTGSLVPWIEFSSVVAATDYGATATPATITATAAVATATVSAGWTAAPATVAATASVGAPTVGGGATATPATIAAVATVAEVEDLTLAGHTLVLNETWASGTLDTAKWDVEASTYGQPSRVGRYVAANVVVSTASAGGVGNSLKLRCSNDQTGDVDGGATSRWLGGMISTRDLGVYYPRAGRYEIRARVHHGFGVWPAFWLRHRDGSDICEIDIMEYFHAEVPGHTVGVLHRTNEAGTFQSNVNPGPRYGFCENVVAEGSQGWHTFAVEFRPNAVDPDDIDFSWSIDGTVFETYTDTSAQNWWDRYDQQSFDITLQGAQIGGNYIGHPNDPLGYSRGLDACIIGGTPPNSCTTTFSGQTVRRSELADISAGGSAATILGLEVDYVRVWRWDAGDAQTPATVAATASVGAVTVQRGWTAAPATAAAAASVGAPAVRIGADRAPATVAAVGAVGAATVTAGVGATTSPATVAAAAGVGAPTVRAGWTVVPATVAAAAAVGTVLVRQGGGVNPATVAAVAAVGAPSVGGSAQVSAATVAAAAAVGVAAVTASSNITPGTVAATAGVGAPTVTVAVTRAPATVAAAAAVGALTVTVSGDRAPVTVAAVAGVGAPTVRASANVAPATITATAAVGLAAAGGGTTVTPATVVAAAGVGAVTVQRGWTAAPATVTAAAAVGAAAVRAGWTASPATVAAAAGIGAPFIIGGGADTRSPATITATAAVATATVRVTVTRPGTGTVTRPGAATVGRPAYAFVPRPHA